MTPEEIEQEKHTLSEVIRVKKENIEYWNSSSCGLDKPTATLSIQIAERDIAKYQKRLDDLPEPAKEVAEVEEIEPAKTEEFEDPILEG